MVFSANRYLTREEMTVNAQYLMNEFLGKGWSKNAIAGMLGNMETESTINPGIWQNLNPVSSNGFGLVQWTPSTNYTNWATANGYAHGDINGQIARIIYELNNGLQWISTSSYPLSFQEFSTSSQSPEYLAQAFLRNYERPANQNQPNRSTQARYWYDTLSGEGGGGGKPFYPAPEHLPITSPYGMRFHPIDEVWKFHAGIDIGGGGVTHPIYATQSGVVIQNRWSDTGGWMIYIRHTGDTYYSRYLHLDSQSPIPVGATVTKGQEIGTMGTTGTSTAIHLHFEVGYSESGLGTEAGTIDPEIYLQMEFGGGDGGDKEKSKMKDLIFLLLSDQLNGWKY